MGLVKSVAGVILAGGASQRMGQEKALALLGGRALIAHVIARFAPQVGPLAVSANGDPGRFSAFDVPILADGVCARGGPLAGVHAGLGFAENRGCDLLAVVPVDAPFLPLDLVVRLASSRRSNEIAAAAGPEGLEPLFSLWPIAAKSALAGALERGERGAARTIQSLPHRLVEFAAADPNPFLNVNRPDDLVRASRWFGDGGNRAS
jgi:molybdenum cofactor guanylyltransferase